MNLVDALIVGAMMIAAFVGARAGAIRGIACVAGAALGITVGAKIAAELPSMSGSLRHVRSALVLIACGAAGILLARAMSRREPLARRRSIGALATTAVTLFAAWFIGGLLPTSSTTGVAGEANASTVLHQVNRVAPRLREVFGDQSSQLFGWIEPPPARRLPAPPGGQLESAIAVAAPSTVKVTGVSCGRATLGSGVVMAPDLVVTTAHVVAGAEELLVLFAISVRPAVPILVDARADLAVLYVRGLARDPLPLATVAAVRGTIGAVLGYPGGRALATNPAIVLASHRASGRDIYGRDRVMRDILEVQAQLGPGASGGPLVDSNGAVLGVLFGQSEDHPDIVYALTASAIRVVIDEARRLPQGGDPVGVPTGECLPS